MGEQKPEKTKKHICAGLLAHVCAGKPIGKHVTQGPRALVELIWTDSFSRRLR